MFFSLYFIIGSIIASVCPYANRIWILSVNFAPSSAAINFNCPLSCIGNMFSFKNEAFSRSLGFTAQSQCCSLLQYVAFLKAGINFKNATYWSNEQHWD